MSQPKIPPWAIILLLLVFPPLAWIFMYQDPYYHRWFPYLLWLTIIPTAIMYLLQVIFISSRLNQLYGDFYGPQAHTSISFLPIIGIAISLVEMIAGFSLHQKIKGTLDSYKKYLNIVVGILIFNLIFMGYYMSLSFYNLITPIYSLP